MDLIFSVRVWDIRPFGVASVQTEGDSGDKMRSLLGLRTVFLQRHGRQNGPGVWNLGILLWLREAGSSSYSRVKVFRAHTLALGVAHARALIASHFAKVW